MRVVLTGGGNGGHLIPFAPLIATLRTHFFETRGQLPAWVEPEGIDIYFLGVIDAAGKEFFDRYSVPATVIPSGKLRRYWSGLTLIDLLFRLPIGIILALLHMWRLMPEVVISKGGYGSLPTVIAAKVYRIPVLLHESDVMPGLANRRLARFATAIAVGYQATKDNWPTVASKIFVTGTPVRQELTHVTRAEARQAFSLPLEEKVLLVMGGSQGAQQINEVLLAALPELLREAAIIHITGNNNFSKITTVAQEIVAASPRKHLYKVYPYLRETMIHAFVAADVVVSRAGASTLAELAHLRKPTLLIPLAGAANDHQRHNAQVHERFGAARVLDPANVNRSLFLRNVHELLVDEELRRHLAEGMSQLDYPDAATTLAEVAFTLAAGKVPTTYDHPS